MAVTLRTTTTKPAAVAWYGRSSPEAAATFLQIEAWMEALPGFLGHTQSIIDENTRYQEIIFDTEANYINYRTLREQCQPWQNREAYNNANGVEIDLQVIID
jgi:hypothetical protein